MNDTLKKTGNTQIDESEQLKKIPSTKEMTKETLQKSNAELKLISDSKINIVETPGREDTSNFAVDEVTAVLNIEKPFSAEKSP